MRNNARSRRTVVLVCGAALSIGSAQVAAKNETCDYTVAGTGDADIDVPALQAAMSGPHAEDSVTVCVTGTLEFAGHNVLIFPLNVDPGTVMAELNLVGLDDQNGKATIHGGLNPLVVPAGVAGVTNDLETLRIENLRIVDAKSSAILVSRTNELLEITGVDVEGVTTITIVLPPSLEFHARAGIVLTAFPATPDSRIAGSVVIADTTVDGGSYLDTEDADIIAPAGIGIFGYAARPLEARVEVRGNAVSNWSGSGIVATYANDLVVAGNSIRTGTFANVFPIPPLVALDACVAANGIGAGSGISLMNVGSSVVRSNQIVVEPSTTGDALPPECNAGMILVGDSTGNEFTANRIAGEGSYAIVVGRDSTAGEEGNRFRGNNLNSFAPYAAALFLGAGAAGNTFQGRVATIEGNAAGNSITGR